MGQPRGDVADVQRGELGDWDNRRICCTAEHPEHPELLGDVQHERRGRAPGPRARRPRAPPPPERVEVAAAATIGEQPTAAELVRFELTAPRSRRCSASRSCPARTHRDQRALAGLEHVVRRLAIAAAHRAHPELLQLLGDVQHERCADLEHGARELHGRATAAAAIDEHPTAPRRVEVAAPLVHHGALRVQISAAAGGFTCLVLELAAG